ncbi:glycosyltransferase N-terminal domain-containing protein [Winogradskyella sp.]|uniref:3-deoxy-D-manno-octulosonic acid transferase n=1 Tax=Winogradskyella sp. TaxID=1883156 RepID=UPI003453A68E
MLLKLLYSIGIHIVNSVLKPVSLFNDKIKLGVIGRKETFKILESSISKTDRTIWMHCASLGEYEQGLPVLKALRSQCPNHKIIVSFFSPSGYEVKKNTKDVDVVVYLPFDTSTNANKFLNLVRPDLILFVKYEIWPNLLLEAKKRNIHTLLISATFRVNQSYFNWYGSYMKKALFSFNHIFTQDEASKNILIDNGYKSVSVSGDTRFDRVTEQLQDNNTIEFIDEFIDDKTTVVFGSTWPADDELFVPFINSNIGKAKYIIAPHNIKPNYIDSIENQLEGTVVRFSQMKGKKLSEYNIFILDTIGYLSRVYSYADIAYVGGAAGQTGLHNILEPAVFGIPIIIGKNYDKFPEAKTLINLGGIKSVTNTSELGLNLKVLVESKDLRLKLGAISSEFISEHKGAVVQILDYIRTYTNLTK